MKKVKVMIMGTGNATKEFIYSNINNNYIEIIGLILDSSVGDDTKAEFTKIMEKSVEIYEFSDASFSMADIVFTPEYRKIIPAYFAEKYLIVNCHGGILPKWRGFSANAWAIMNGESEVGFSIHRVRPGLDDGEIYYVKHIPISEDETYGDVYQIMLDGISKEVPQVLYDIVNKKNTEQQQPSDGFVYCNKFTKEMGNITGFNNTSQYYTNLYRCMAKPLGTGIWFEYKNRKYVVNKVEHGKKYGVVDYIGINGKIVNITNNKIWVKTKDNVVVLSEIENEDSIIVPSTVFRNGIKL